jgi:hypothetical protein
MAMRKCFTDNGWTEDDILKATGRKNIDDVSAEDLASAMADMQIKRTRENQQDAVYVSNMKTMTKAMRTAPDTVTPARALHGMLSRDWTEQVGFLSADQRINAIRSMAKSHISDFMEALSPSARQTFLGIFTGKRNLSKEQDALMRNTIREVFGETTGNADAQKFAKGWKKQNDELIERYGKAGGDIRVREDWKLPQSHDRERMRAMGMDTWVKTIKDLLDLEKMGKTMRNQADTDAMKADNMHWALEDSFRNITTGHIGNKTKAVADNMKDSRFLIFKDSESWLKYQEILGEPNIYASMLGNVDTMARNIGLMETFGPDPYKGFDDLSLQATKMSPVGGKFTDRGHNLTRARSTFELLSNQNTVEGYELGGFDAGIANSLTNIRNAQVASKLGSAVLSTLSDVVFTGQTARYNGLPVVKTLVKTVANAISSTARDLPTGIDGKGGVRKWAQDFGFGAEYALDRSFLSYDYMQSSGNMRTRLAAESVMQMSGMNTWTHSARATFQYEMAVGLSRMADSGVLKPKVVRALARYGITADDWELMRASKRTSYKGQDMLDPRKMTPELATKYVGMVDGEMGMAVPTPDARVRSQMTFGQKSGTPMGELTRGLTQFHSFNATVLMNNLTRMVSGKFSGNMDRYSQMVAMAATATILGAVVIQTKELLNGKETMDWDDPKLWARGVAQSGLGSYIGDFYAKEAMGYSNTSPLDYAGGAPVAYATALAKAASADTMEEKIKILAKFTSKEIPFQNLWYSKLATDRLLLDRVRRMTDPKYDQKMKSKINRMKKSTGQEYWYAPETGR